MSGLAHDGTAEAVSRDQFRRREGENTVSLFSCDHKQNWKPYTVHA